VSEDNLLKTAFIFIVIVTIMVACLVGCGSAAPQVDHFKEDCISQGGTYTEFENASDSCVYNNVS
jgi:hypothetical protein